MSPWPANTARLVLRSVDSTSLEAARQADGIAGPTWICALEQTAAKGRRGRAWANPPGNFAASLVYRPQASPDQMALRSFVASLALYDALVAATGQTAGQTAGLALKWPNDVLLNGGKLAGILLETAPGGALIIGIGVNLRNAPAQAALEEGALPAVALASETGSLVAPEAFLDHLAPAFDALETQFTTYGFAPIRTRWLSLAAKLGQPITARTSRETLSGTFETIDASGQLILRTAHGPRTIAAGDVFF